MVLRQLSQAVALTSAAFGIAFYLLQPTINADYSRDTVITHFEQDQKAVCADVNQDGRVDLCLIDQAQGTTFMDRKTSALYLRKDFAQSRDIRPTDETSVRVYLPPTKYNYSWISFKGKWQELSAENQRRYDTALEVKRLEELFSTP